MKSYVFHSPKTAGNTIACLNLALAYQLAHPTVRVAFVPLTRYPDAAQYLGLKTPKQTLSQLIEFIDSPEWSPELLNALKDNQIVDVLPSPTGNQWQDITTKDWATIMDLVNQTYDVVFVDLGRDIPETIQNICLKRAHQIITTTCLDPVSLSALETFLNDNKDFKAKQLLLINQAPREATPLIKKHLKAHESQILGILPFEQKHMWDQVYKGFPLVLHKKSKWKTALTQVLNQLEKR